MAEQTIPDQARRRKRRPAPPPPAQADDSWHKAYGQTTDEHGRVIRNWESWRRCECQIGADHDG